MRLKGQLSSYQENLEGLNNLKQKKEGVWSTGLNKIEGEIELAEERIQDTECLLRDLKGQKAKQMIKRKAKALFEENRVKRRAISSQGRPALLDSEDEEFVAKCIEDKATYHGRRHDTVMYTNKRVKKRDLLNIANYKLLQRGKKVIRSVNTVYNRSRPRHMHSLQARRHCGKGLFCFKKPPKAEDNDNENTHYQRGHIKNIKLSFFSNKVDAQTRNLCFMRSTDDKAYLRPGTSEGFEKCRNVKILNLTDVNRARVLPKYDWPEKLVYITPAAHRIFTKKGSITDDVETLETDEDHHFVYVRPKAIIGSSGSVWASETVDLRHRSPDVFEVPTVNGNIYTKGFRSFCAQVHDYVFQYVDMTNVIDLSKMTTKSECPHRLYEASRINHAQNGLKRASETLGMDMTLTDAENTLIASRVVPKLSQIQSTLDELHNQIYAPDFSNISVGQIMILNARLKDTSNELFDIFDNLKLPKVKPKWADLTDAGPGVGVSNYLVRFRDAELARLYNSDYRVRCHRSRGDSGQGEAERTNSAIGDSIIDGETLEWEKTKCFQGMTEEEVQSMSVKDFQEYEKKRMENNAWEVANEVKARIHDVPVLSEYITAYLTMKKEDQFFFNEANILAFSKSKSSSATEQIPGSGYMKKISTFVDLHYQVGELYMEYLKKTCREHQDGQLCDFCKNHPWVGPEGERIPQPIPDPQNLPHFKSVFLTPVRNEDESRRIPDDWQPRAQLKCLFHSSKITLDDTDAIKEYATKYAVEEKYVRSYLEHLNTLRLKESIRSNQRKTDKDKRDLKGYEEYDWLDMALKGTLKQLVVKEIDKYLDAHGLRKYGNKADKIKTVTCHVLRENNISEIEEKQTDSMPDTDSDDSDSDSDDDYVFGTFGSDSES